MIKLVLPYPISANRYWRSFAIQRKGAAKHSTVVTVSKEAKAFKEEVGWLCKAAGIRGPLRGHVSLSFRLVPANGICMDLDNCLKVAIDSLKDIAFLDDSQVYEIRAQRCMPDGKARLEVEITEFAPPQAPLFEGLPIPEKKPVPRETEGVPF